VVNKVVCVMLQLVAFSLLGLIGDLKKLYFE